MKHTNKTHEVILAYNGPNVAYNDAEFRGTEEECREYIRKVLRMRRRIQGQQHDGTFLAVRDAKTYEWVK